MSASGELVEGISVNLTCSSDANPAANYTWYKENENSPVAMGRIFSISDFTAELSGNYYCEAQNSRGHDRFPIRLALGTGEDREIRFCVSHIMCFFVPQPTWVFGLHHQENGN